MAAKIKLTLGFSGEPAVLKLSINGGTSGTGGGSGTEITMYSASVATFMGDDDVQKFFFVSETNPAP